MSNLVELFPEIAAEWSPKNSFSAASVSYGSRKSVWWVCSKCQHEYEKRVDTRTGRGVGCPQCAGRKLDPLSKTHPELTVEWHPSNQTFPDQVTAGMKLEVKWQGSCGHEWLATIRNRTKPARPSGCPYCTNRKTNMANSVAVFPNLVAEWHPDNALKPEEVNFRSYTKVKWKGKCGHEWETMVRTRTRQHRPAGCPICNDSRGEQRIAEVLRNLGWDFEEQKRFSDCRGDKPLPFDFCVGKVLIEYQGEHHYYPVDFGGDSKDRFTKTQKHDKIKESWCAVNEFKLIVIPFTEYTKIEQIILQGVGYPKTYPRRSQGLS
jgi:DNA-directed RNA polymerase subunit RPC12/RpoP